MDEILINSTTVGVQHQPSVTGFLGSHFAVVWTDAGTSTIRGQILTDSGERSGAEFIANSPGDANTKRHRPVVARVPGGFVIAWLEEALNPPGPRPHIKLQRYNGSARPIGSEVQVSITDADTSQQPALSLLIDGGFVVTWADRRADRRILAQRFSADGTKKGDEILVNAGEGFHVRPLVATLVDGNFVVAWTKDPVVPSGGGLALRIFNIEGSPVGEELQPNVFGGHATTLLDNGRFVIAHVKRGILSDIGVEMNTIRADVFEANGTLANIPLFVSSENNIHCSSPSLAPLPGGRFVASWLQKKADTFDTNTSVRAAVFSDGQGMLGRELQINTTTAGDRFKATVGSIFGGDAGEAAFFAWDDSSGSEGDSSDFAVRGRCFKINTGMGLE